MQNATPVAVHVMGATEGAAWRIQLDGMIKVLAPLFQDAFDAGDTAVTMLYTHLHEAQALASVIEQRDAPTPNAYQGVDLIKH